MALHPFYLMWKALGVLHRSLKLIQYSTVEYCNVLCVLYCSTTVNLFPTPHYVLIMIS